MAELVYFLTLDVHCCKLWHSDLLRDYCITRQSSRHKHIPYEVWLVYLGGLGLHSRVAACWRRRGFSRCRVPAIYHNFN